MGEFDVVVIGVVEPGLGYASGVRSEKYPEGTINLQRPHFAKRGFDISHCFGGTINLSIAPRRCRIKAPEWVFRDVRWTDRRAAETFFLGRCRIENGAEKVDGFIYCPDPGGKDSTVDNPCQLQLLAPLIPNVSYGTQLRAWLRSEEFETVE
jgi:hypothetical protein